MTDRGFHNGNDFRKRSTFGAFVANFVTFLGKLTSNLKYKPGYDFHEGSSTRVLENNFPVCRVFQHMEVFPSAGTPLEYYPKYYFFYSSSWPWVLGFKYGNDFQLWLRSGSPTRVLAPFFRFSVSWSWIRISSLDVTFWRSHPLEDELKIVFVFCLGSQIRF